MNTRYQMNVYKFPYDSQSCPIMIRSWDISSDQLTFGFVIAVLSYDFVKNSIWKMSEDKNTIKICRKNNKFEKIYSKEK